MQLKTLLDRVRKHPSFVYEGVRLIEHPRLAIKVEIRPRANARARCSRCARAAPGYDTLAVRRFEFVPLWHIPVVFLYAMRRVGEAAVVAGGCGGVSDLLGQRLSGGAHGGGVGLGSIATSRASRRLASTSWPVGAGTGP